MEKRRCRKERVAGMTLFDIPFSISLPLSICLQPLKADEYKAGTGGQGADVSRESEETEKRLWAACARWAIKVVVVPPVWYRHCTALSPPAARDPGLPGYTPARSTIGPNECRQMLWIVSRGLLHCNPPTRHIPRMATAGVGLAIHPPSKKGSHRSNGSHCPQS